MRSRQALPLLVFLCGLTSCKAALREAPGLPIFPLDGLWMEKGTFQDSDGEIRLLLDIRASSDAQTPYEFRLLRTTHRDLVVSGKILIYSEITGRILTSKHEALLRRDTLHRASMANRNREKADIWPLEEYEGEMLDRHVVGGVDLEVLKLSADGNTLQGGGWTFVRAVPLSTETKTFRALGVVLRAGKDGTRARIGHFSQELLRAGGPYDILRGSKVIGKTKVTAGMQREALAEGASAQFTLGDVLVTTGKAPAQNRLPTREEVLEKLKRGEQVPREILIQVLGKD